MAAETKEISLKLLIDGSSKKVLYAEARKDFVDFLFGLLQIPIGSLVGLFRENRLSAPGCFGRILNSLTEMDVTHFNTTAHKEYLVRPKLASSNFQHTPPLLLQDLIGSFTQMEIYRSNYDYDSSSSSPGVGYVKEGFSGYMVMDDLVVNPMSTISIFTLLKTFNISDLGTLEEKTVKIDWKKGLELVKASLESDTVLTDVFIRASEEDPRDEEN